MPPLKARVVFAADQNGDRKTDLADYRLWMNRQLPDADSIYLTHIWYKTFMDHHTGMRTTINQAREIIEAISNVTDGLPQIPCLVGWQEGGHDHKYPSMGTVNQRIGGPAALRELFAACKQRYNTILSYHQNIDDAYADSADWDPDFCGPKGICHTIDVEKGAVFRRLDTMLEAIPVEKTLHFDNMRITNTHTAEGFRHIGIMEELVCGLMPIIDYLRKKGITITTEGQNGMPCDASLVVQGFWHFDIRRRNSGGC